MTLGLVVAGALAGVAFGYVLKRDDLCFHSMFRGLYERCFLLFKIWILGVAVGALGLAMVFSFGPWDGLLRGLALRPRDNVVGGLVFGVGMVVAASCVSGLYYKLGSGMFGAAVGLAGWIVGELAAHAWWTPGEAVLGFGREATLYGLLGVNRFVVVIPLVAVVIGLVARTARDDPGESWRWGWPLGGVALGGATTLAWVTAGISGANFGPSTVGAVASIAEGSPNWWLIGFLVALSVGAVIAARTAGGWSRRRESASRYAGLLVGGAFLGAGGWIAGGCNLGHGVSGMSQLNVSSLLVVTSMVAGVGVARWVQVRFARPLPDWRPGVPRSHAQATR